MKKILLLSVLLIPFPGFSYSLLQEKGFYAKESPVSNLSGKKFDKEKLTYGGNFWFQIGTYTYLDISPMIGYRVTEKFVPGIGINYTYMQQRLFNQSIFRSNLYGIRGFLRYDILDYVFVYGEYEFLNWDYYDNFLETSRRRWTGTPLIGGGYRQQGDNVAFMVYALYAFNSEKIDSPYYQRPLVLRVGFMFG